MSRDREADICASQGHDAWDARLNSVMDAQGEVKRQLKVVETQIESLLDRIVDAGSHLSSKLMGRA